MKQRADELLIAAGLAATLDEARARILAGEVWLSRADGTRVSTAGQLLGNGTPLELRRARGPFESRAGAKLAGALDAFALDVRGLDALDVGASTGGFTDCLLERGVARVTAVDVGKGLLAQRLRDDPKVRLLEGVNARHLEPTTVGGPFAVVTVDVSFISVTLLLPALVPLLGGDLLVLVKPQFEAPRDRVPRGGVVDDPAVERASVDRVAAASAALGLAEAGRTPSSLRGARGNQEHFLWLRR